jgi:hypothetical protein
MFILTVLDFQGLTLSLRFDLFSEMTSYLFIDPLLNSFLHWFPVDFFLKLTSCWTHLFFKLNQVVFSSLQWLLLLLILCKCFLTWISFFLTLMSWWLLPQIESSVNFFIKKSCISTGTHLLTGYNFFLNHWIDSFQWLKSRDVGWDEPIEQYFRLKLIMVASPFFCLKIARLKATVRIVAHISTVCKIRFSRSSRFLLRLGI